MEAQYGPRVTVLAERGALHALEPVALDATIAAALACQAHVGSGSRRPTARRPAAMRAACRARRSARW